MGVGVMISDYVVRDVTWQHLIHACHTRRESAGQPPEIKGFAMVAPCSPTRVREMRDWLHGSNVVFDMKGYYIGSQLMAVGFQFESKEDELIFKLTFY